jgi:T5SS/PEP-CTERM-associated repeat protein
MNLANADGEMVVAKNNGSVGRLNITGGGQVTGFSTDIALGAGSMGFVTVDGPDSTWTNSERLIVGRSGVGTLTVSGGGHVIDRDVSLGAANAGQGIVNVTGADSAWTQSLDLRVGASLGSVNGVPQFGFGTLSITSGGQVDTAGDASISALTSKATVDGSGSVWNVGGELSTDSAAVLEIKSGGTVNSDSAFVGISRDGTATVNGLGSTWNVFDSLFVGRNGTGTLNVTSGGRLDTRLGFLGMRSAVFGMSSALVQVDGVGSVLNSTEQLFVGFEDEASLNVTNGGRVTTGTGHLGFTAAGEGRVHVAGAGSQWISTESLYVGVSAIGNLTVSNGGIATVDDLLSIGPRGTVQGNSTIAADIRNSGIVAPGVSPSLMPGDALGALRIDGDYRQTVVGALQIQLDSATVFDKLNVTGEADLSGLLDVTFSNNGFSPTAGMIFEILRADGGVFNSFTTTSLPTLDPDLTWNVIYSNFAVLLSVLNIPLGDYNHNGFVDAADYAVWRDTLGQMGIGLAADGNHNGSVDAGDYEVWRGNFGKPAVGAGAAAGRSSSVVPEPPSITLWLFALLLLRRRPV